MRNVQRAEAAPAGSSHRASDRPAAESPSRYGTADKGWSAWFEDQKTRVDRTLAAHLNALKSAGPANSRLAESVEYSVRLGGKRVRPILTLEACRVCGGEEADALPAALAVECVHTFSLIHDDLPAMDDDDLRRGHPTNHKVFGDALAILSGDWLLAHAFTLLAERPGETTAALVRTLAAATQDMTAGQAADMAGQARPTEAELVRYIHLHKTARLIEASCRLGALAAQASPAQVDALGSFGRHLGLAFQIADDLLDAEGSEEALGKRVGKDAQVAKQTFPAAFGGEESRSAAQRHVDAATAALQPFGAAAGRLAGLARFVIRRDR